MKEIIIYANCQGNSINYILNKYYSNLFTMKIYYNFVHIEQNIPLPDFSNADIFIYQNYSEKEKKEYDLSYILNHKLKDKCNKICISFLQFDAIFCYNEDDENNKKTINSENPFGKCFFGIDLIVNYFKNNIITEEKQNEINNEIINEVQTLLLNENSISDEKILYNYNRSFEYLEKKLLNSDVPELYYFIKENFTKIRLFYNRYHPTGILLNEQIKLILKLINIEFTPSEEDITIINNMYSDLVMPILPSVRKFYGIDFPDTCSSWYNKDISDTKTFIETYVKELYF